MTADLRRLDIIDHDRFGQAYPYEEWARLRAEAPVCPMDIPGWEPFWALATPGPIREVSSQPEVFRSGPSLHVRSVDDPPGTPSGHAPPEDLPYFSLINMDPPIHGVYRRLVSRHLSRARVAALRPRLTELAHDLLDRTWTSPPAAACEFVADVAEWYPFHLIADQLGIPEEDHQEVLELLNGNLLGSLPRLMTYMRDLALARRAQPGDDLGTVLSTARIDGRLLEDHELASYYATLATAGHGTVRNSLAGAVLAFAEHPGSLEHLRRHPEALGPAVEEVLRWTSPVVSFARTAATDATVGGCPVKAGDRLALLYASANRDEETFDDPEDFRLDRSPNPHLAFGIGEHYCLGAHLARLELSTFLQAFAQRVTDLEVTGDIARYRSSLLSGVERLPIRFTLRPRS